MDGSQPIEEELAAAEEVVQIGGGEGVAGVPMRILKLDSKHGATYFDVNSKEKYLAAMRFIFGMNSWMYANGVDPGMQDYWEKANGGDIQSMRRFVEDRSRSNCEYETFHIIKVINPLKESYDEDSS